MSFTICTAGFHSYVDSPFGKPRQTVHFSAVRCVGSESRLTDCPTTNYTYEQGRLFAEHLAVAGVACQQCYCECPLSTVEVTMTTSQCPAITTVKTVTQIVTLRPTQQAQLDSDNSQQQTITTILLTGLATCCMVSNMNGRRDIVFFCQYSLCYKIGKNKRLSGSQEQVDNDQYGSQPNEISLNPNSSYTKHTNVPSYTERCKETTVYEDVNCLVDQ